MGWWKVRDTENLVGDEVFSLMRQAALEIAQLYEAEFDRLPKRAEWEILMSDALEPIETLDSYKSKSLFLEDGRPETVEIKIGRKRGPQ